jgi:uncharacterized damage-inducible protein DinB
MNVLSLEGFAKHFAGHRELTLKLVDAFPEEALSSHHAPEMRTFLDILKEIYQVEVYTMHGILSKEWFYADIQVPFSTKTEIMAAFDALNTQTAAQWASITAERLNSVEKCLWMESASNTVRLMYMLDNEIHHRAQGYVYLRELGVTPPSFYERTM